MNGRVLTEDEAKRLLDVETALVVSGRDANQLARGTRMEKLLRILRLRRSDRLARILTERELAYLSRAIFRHRIDKPDDEPELAAQLDPMLSVARMHAK